MSFCQTVAFPPAQWSYQYLQDSYWPASPPLSIDKEPCYAEAHQTPLRSSLSHPLRPGLPDVSPQLVSWRSCLPAPTFHRTRSRKWASIMLQNGDRPWRKGLGVPFCFSRAKNRLFGAGLSSRITYFRRKIRDLEKLMPACHPPESGRRNREVLHPEILVQPDSSPSEFLQDLTFFLLILLFGNQVLLPQFLQQLQAGPYIV